MQTTLYVTSKGTIKPVLHLDDSGIDLLIYDGEDGHVEVKTCYAILDQLRTRLDVCLQEFKQHRNGDKKE